MVKRIINKLIYLSLRDRINILKTFVVNFMLLPFKQALHFPILIYGPCKLGMLRGKVILSSPIKKGMLQIGASDSIRSYHNKSFVEINGMLEIHDRIVLRRGLNLHIATTGHIVLENDVFIGDNNTIISFEYVKIGKATRIGNNNTFMDSDFHYTISTQTREVKRNKKPIVIGENATLLSMNIIVPQTIIFAGCFDDLSISNINRNRIQNNNITGVYVNLDITKYIKMISDKYVDNIAYLYTKNSEMSANISKYIGRYCRNENITYHPLIIDGNLDSIDIENNIKSKNIDYIILANEDYINNNIYSISYLCDKYSIPLINTDISEAVNTAILFSLDFNYYYLGRQLALVLNEVINNNGKTEGVDFLKLSDSYEILVNEDIAEEYDIKLTEEIHNISSFLIKDGKVIKK